MNEKEKQSVKAFLDIGKEVSIPILPKNKWHRLLQRLGIAKRELKYTLKKIKVGNRERIGVLSENIPNDLNDGTPMLTKIMELSAKITKDLIYCAAVALQNDNKEPSKELLEALKWVDDEFLADVLEMGISEIDIKNFLKSIVLIKGTKSLMSSETL